MWAALALVIHVTLRFDPSIRSKIVRTTVGAEADAIWRGYGVELDWTSGSHANLCLAASIDRSSNSGEPGTPSVLGSTSVSNRLDDDPAPIRIGFDALDAFVEPTTFSNAVLHEYAVGTAIGRVLAHEIGHILLGAPSYHDQTGLMRRSFLPSDFTQAARWRFRLDERSVPRLQERLASFAHVPIAPGCPQD